ncbi:MAG: hypothetical protein LBG58_14570 [Planctomycetaceae bacterium]|jgi:hypothetical protein|nr:hypothetical protein [Planctomycetaceae bacterium]
MISETIKRTGLFLCCFWGCFSVVTAEVPHGSDASDILIQAIQKSGYNPQLFKSAYAVFQVTSENIREKDSPMFEKSWRAMEARLRVKSNKSPEELEKGLKDVEKVYRRLYGAGTYSDHFRMTFLVKGTYYSLQTTFDEKYRRDHNILNDDSLHTDRRVSKAHRQRLFNRRKIEPIEGQTSSDTHLHHSNVEDETSWWKASLDENGPIISVNEDPSSEHEILLFGRVQGYLIEQYVEMLLNGSDYQKFSFSRSGQKKFADYCTKKNIKIINTGEVTYDDNQKASVIEVFMGDVREGIFWIDVNRDYVCPLVQISFDRDGTNPIYECTASDFVPETTTKLWYPRQFKITKKFGELMINQEYVLEPDTLQINQPVSDDQFVIDTHPGMNIFDNRKGHDNQYRISEAGTFSFKGGRFDPEKMDILGHHDKLVKRPWTNIVFVVVGTVLITVAVIRLVLQRIRKKK